MREQLKVRLGELKKEFEIGQTRLQEMERQQTLLRETLLRISGAIQVLEEALSVSNEQPENTPVSGSEQDAGSTPAVQRSGA